MKLFRSILLIYCCVYFKTVFGAQTCSASNQCSELQYCSRVSNLCQNCEEICTKSNHNQYDENKCDRECKHYIEYLNKADVKTLKILVTISLTLNCLIILGLIITAVLWKTKRGLNISWLRNKLKKNEKSKQDRSTTVSVTNASGKPDLRLDMPALGIQTPSANGNTPSTATTTLSRRPTEDSALDYAYDNPAMSNTPSPHESMSRRQIPRAQMSIQTNIQPSNPSKHTPSMNENLY